jgi:hypothetical protein
LAIADGCGRYRSILLSKNLAKLPNFGRISAMVASVALAIAVTTLRSKLVTSVLNGDQRLVELDGRIDGRVSHHNPSLG